MYLGLGVHMLGIKENPIYLLGKKNNYTLIEGGLISTTEVVIEQLKKMNIKFSEIKSWIITHSHFDHCGLLQTLYPKFSNVKMYAPLEVIESFKNEKYLRQIKKYNEFVEPNLAKVSCQNISDIKFIALKDNEILKVGVDEFEVIKTEGHSPCSYSFWNKRSQVLFVSDALGELREDFTFFPLAFQSISLFAQSLNKLLIYDPKIVALGHNGALTGWKAKNAVREAIEGLKKFYEKAELLHEKGLNIEQAAREFSKILYPHSASFVPKELHYFSMLRQLNNLVNETIY